MGSDSILRSRDLRIKGYCDLLARRLCGPDLLRARTLVESSFDELGGGPARVERRLRSTLAWCRNDHDDGLTLDSVSLHISCAAPGRHGTEYSHHLAHARTVLSVSNELGLMPDRRRALIDQALMLAGRVRDRALSNTSARLNVGRTDDEWRVDLIRADRRARKRKHAELCAQVVGLNALRADGWIIRVYTINLPPGYHPCASHEFGLAGSPDISEAAQVLRLIVADAMPNRDSTKLIAGVRRIERHKSDVPHANLIIAFRTQDDADRFDERLRDSYMSRTYPGWSFKVIAGFGYTRTPEFPESGFEPPPKARHAQPIPICADTIIDSDHLARCVSYQLKGLGNDAPDLIPGRIYDRLGALRKTNTKVVQLTNTNLGKPFNPIDKIDHLYCAPLLVAPCSFRLAEYKRIKIYRDNIERPQVASCPLICACWPRVSPRPAFNKYARPAARAPPLNPVSA